MSSVEPKFKIGDRVKVLLKADSEYDAAERAYAGKVGVIMDDNRIPDVLMARDGVCCTWYESELELVNDNKNRHCSDCRYHYNGVSPLTTVEDEQCVIKPDSVYRQGCTPACKEFEAK